MQANILVSLIYFPKKKSVVKVQNRMCSFPDFGEKDCDPCNYPV